MVENKGDHGCKRVGFISLITREMYVYKRSVIVEVGQGKDKEIYPRVDPGADCSPSLLLHFL